MAYPLITTKLFVPKPRQGLVSRPGLLERLDKGISKKLTLISASSGYGKTTLMAEWCAAQAGNYPIAWISLDEGDNDPVHFLSYLIAGLQKIHDGIGEDSRIIMEGVQNPLDTGILTLLINELSAVPEDFVLVLEDYHLIETQEIHQMMIFLLEHLPPQMHVVILTRADPAFPLSRWRARGELFDIRDRDLRFSFDDAKRLLHDIAGLHLSEESIYILMDRTEGWITGLQLAVLAMQGLENPSDRISDIGSGHGYIVDYLIEEVLERQPDKIKLFLLQTSILNRLNGPLCDVLTGLSDGEYTLERLEKANMFLTSLGGEYRWYRYHHLFAFVMTNRLQRFFPEQIPELHLRAAKWFQQNDLILDAIEHALTGKNYGFAVEMAESFCFSLLKEGHISTLIRLLGKFPEDVIRKSPRLMIVRIRMMIAVEKDAYIEQYLRIAEERSVATGEYDVLHGEFLLIQASAAARQGDYENAYIFAQDALENLSDDNYLARSEMHFVLGRIYFKQDDFPKALSELKEASLYGKLSGNLTNAVAALCSAGTIYLQLEDFSEAESAFAEAEKLATAPSGKYLPYASTVLGCLADLYIDQRNLEKAKYFAQETVDLGEQWINGDSQVRGLLALARVAHFEGKSYEANRFLEKAKQIDAAYSLVPDAIQGIMQTDEFLQSSASRNSIINQDKLVEPLTARELEILGLFAVGLSNQEIADRLFISLGTVKAHSSNIYRKLDVRNRAQAVNTARQLKLL